MQNLLLVLLFLNALISTSKHDTCHRQVMIEELYNGDRPDGTITFSTSIAHIGNSSNTYTERIVVDDEDFTQLTTEVRKFDLNTPVQDVSKVYNQSIFRVTVQDSCQLPRVRFYAKQQAKAFFQSILRETVPFKPEMRKKMADAEYPEIWLGTLKQIGY